MIKNSLLVLLVGLSLMLVGSVYASSLAIIDNPTLSGSELLKSGRTDPQGTYQAYNTTNNIAYNGITPIVSSNISGYNDIHNNAYLNDGFYGNGSSWIGTTTNSWLKIDLGNNFFVDSLSFGRDRLNNYNDRDPGRFTIDVALFDNVFTNGDSSDDGTEYISIFDSNTYSFSGIINFNDTILASFSPVEARFLKVTFANLGVAIDEIEVTGISAVPEPTTMTLLGFGLLGLAGISRKKLYK